MTPTGDRLRPTSCRPSPNDVGVADQFVSDASAHTAAMSPSTAIKRLRRTGARGKSFSFKWPGGRTMARTLPTNMAPPKAKTRNGRRSLPRNTSSNLSPLGRTLRARAPSHTLRPDPPSRTSRPEPPVPDPSSHTLRPNLPSRTSRPEPAGRNPPSRILRPTPSGRNPPVPDPPAETRRTCRPAPAERARTPPTDPSKVE